ncbi:hypothetical protein [Lichenifustis flavocetrariae]|uniref:Uncharacterized protein n=1 Tax=Lichenifustis flavocetrariae TaxID=2949735 RepID=A0AA42CNF9_9HYPH|nr:hypothetical protein [Lichenifustis flavocetrariae]MCW6512736.1 hypothetical protein [Lichenifustis flavocetrariae]
MQTEEVAHRGHEGVTPPIKVLPLSEGRRLFDVNLFGHVGMIHALLPADRERRLGRQLFFLGGKLAMATYGPSAGAKFALEAVSDALRREVGQLGLKVIVIERVPSKPRCLGKSLPMASTSSME